MGLHSRKRVLKVGPDRNLMTAIVLLATAEMTVRLHQDFVKRQELRSGHQSGRVGVRTSWGDDGEALMGGQHSASTSETPGGPGQGRQTERGSLSRLQQETGRMARRRAGAGDPKDEALQDRTEKVNLVYFGLWPMIDGANSR